MKVPIVFTFDDKLILPACVCISSLLQSANSDTFYDIYILHSDKYDFTKTRLAEYPCIFKNCSVTFRTISNEFSSAFEVRGVTTATYNKLLIPESVPEYDKILYSDVDVIFREDLSKFYNEDLDGYYMAGVDNGSAFRPKVQAYAQKHLGIDTRWGHFYAGNLVINSKLILENNLPLKFRELVKRDFNQQDMDIINIACYGKIKPLSPSFCLTNYLAELIVTRKQEMTASFAECELNHALQKGIVHYNGPKPWKEWCVNFDIWWEAYRKSPVYDEKFYFEFFNGKQGELDKLSLLKRIKILLRYFVYGRKK